MLPNDLDVISSGAGSGRACWNHRLERKILERKEGSVESAVPSFVDVPIVSELSPYSEGPAGSGPATDTAATGSSWDS